MTGLARTPLQLGNRVRQARRNQGLSQARLGEQAGLRQETISLIETGNASTRIDTLLKVLAALDLEFRVDARAKGSDVAIEDLF